MSTRILANMICRISFLPCFISSSYLYGALPTAPMYRLELSGFNAGPFFGRVTGWNGSGQATFFIPNTPGSDGFWWDGQTQSKLDTGATSDAAGEDINDSGRIAGWVGRSRSRRAAIWDNGSLAVLSDFEGEESRGQAVNENGVVAGWFDTTSLVETLFTWDGAVHEHGVLPGSSPKVSAINNSLQIVGHESGTLLGGWLWENGVFHQLTDVSGGNHSTARDINELGVVTGTSWVNQDVMRAVKWVDKTLVPLEEPAGVVDSFTFSINNAGAITGGVILENTFESLASVWINDEFYYLRDLVTNLGDWQLQRGISIDEQGRILVYAYSPTLFTQRVILIPIPEPSSMTLAIFGLFVLQRRQFRR